MDSELQPVELAIETYLVYWVNIVPYFNLDDIIQIPNHMDNHHKIWPKNPKFMNRFTPKVIPAYMLQINI